MTRLLPQTVFPFLMFALISQTSMADVYTFQDTEGVTHFSDEPPVEARSYKVYRMSAGAVLRHAVSKMPKSEVKKLVARFSSQYGISPAFVEAIIKAESEYDVMAVSKKGARGLMQLMPATAQSLGVSDLHDPNENLRGGIQHLRGLLTRFNGDISLASAAYNAGETAVHKYNGIPPYAETVDYVQKVRKYYDQFLKQSLAEGGENAFNQPQPTTASPLAF